MEKTRVLAIRRHTEFLLDDLEDLALIKFLGQALHRSQGFTSISLCLRVPISICLNDGGGGQEAASEGLGKCRVPIPDPDQV